MTLDLVPLVLAAPTDLPAVLDHQAVPDPGSLPTEPSDPLQEADLPEVNAPRTPAVLTRLQVRVVAIHLTCTTTTCSCDESVSNFVFFPRQIIMLLILMFLTIVLLNF